MTEVPKPITLKDLLEFSIRSLVLQDNYNLTFEKSKRHRQMTSYNVISRFKSKSKSILRTREPSKRLSKTASKITLKRTALKRKRQPKQQPKLHKKIEKKRKFKGRLSFQSLWPRKRRPFTILEDMFITAFNGKSVTFVTDSLNDCFRLKRSACSVSERLKYIEDINQIEEAFAACLNVVGSDFELLNAFCLKRPIHGRKKIEVKVAPYDNPESKWSHWQGKEPRIKRRLTELRALLKDRRRQSVPVTGLELLRE